MPSKKTSDRRQRSTTRPTTGHSERPAAAFQATPAPAPAPEPGSKYAPSAWGSQSPYTDLKFPSGQLALVRVPGLQGLLKEGILHNLDTLTPFIEEHAAAANGRKPKKGPSVAEIMANPETVNQLMHVLDRITTSCVVQPEIRMTPNDPTTRVQGAVYADQVELDDKLFLFQFVVGGTRDLESFREQTRAVMGGLHSGEKNEGDAR